jgi:hypothetical protein
VQCLFALMSRLPDTNVLHRGGPEGLALARRAAAAFLDAGGVHRPGWRAHAREIDRALVARNLSPGGSADLLAATLFVHRIRSLEIRPLSLALSPWHPPGGEGSDASGDARDRRLASGAPGRAPEGVQTSPADEAVAMVPVGAP